MDSNLTTLPSASKHYFAFLVFYLHSPSDNSDWYSSVQLGR